MLADSATSSAGSERSSVSRSPRAVLPSSPTGWSRLDTGRAARRISMTSSTGRSTIAAISSSVGSRPSWTASSRSTRLILRWRWPMCTGRRIVRAEFSRPRWIDCRIHSVAYVENLKPFRQSNFSEARIRPSMPSWIRSPSVRPWPWYLRATEITNRRLELIIRSLAIMSPRSMRLASWISSAAVSSGYFRASLKNSCRLSVVGSGVSWSFAALAAREALRVFVLELPRWVLGFVGVAVVIVRSLSKLYPKWVLLCNPLTVDKFWSVSALLARPRPCPSPPQAAADRATSWSRGPCPRGTHSRVVLTTTRVWHVPACCRVVRHDGSKDIETEPRSQLLERSPHSISRLATCNRTDSVRRTQLCVTALTSSGGWRGSHGRPVAAWRQSSYTHMTTD